MANRGRKVRAGEGASASTREPRNAVVNSSATLHWCVFPAGADGEGTSHFAAWATYEVICDSEPRTYMTLTLQPSFSRASVSRGLSHIARRR